MDGAFTAAVIQMRTGIAVAPNIAEATAMIREAAGQGAEFVATPENTASISIRKADIQGMEARQDHHPAISAFRSLAEELKIWLLIGSIGIDVETPQGEPAKYANRSFLFDPEGRIVQIYDKIHMFDVTVSEKDTWKESATFEAGTRAAGAKLPWGTLGMTVCYDMRFPHLYRDLAKAGANIFTVPSAFTVPTGEAHWHVLLRARAIETGSFVLAPAQQGAHEDGRETYGHSLIIGPWGDVRAEAPKGPGIIMAKLDMADVTDARRRLPSLSHDRDYSIEIAE